MAKYWTIGHPTLGNVSTDNMFDSVEIFADTTFVPTGEFSVAHYLQGGALDITNVPQTNGQMLIVQCNEGSGTPVDITYNPSVSLTSLSAGGFLVLISINGEWYREY